MEDDYMKDPRAKTLEGMIVACEIFAKHSKEGMKARFCNASEHDIIYGPCDGVEIFEESEDGILLTKFGWHIDSDVDSWAYFT